MSVENELKEVLEKHQKWLKKIDGGERANLRNTNLENVNLSDANLSRADLRFANLEDAYLSRADLRFADLSGSKLWGTNLIRTNLMRADLRHADLDFSAFPLHCGSFDVILDDRIMAQLINHVLSVDHPLTKKLREMETVTSLSHFHKESEKGWK
jgi:uncharacterized protein YjbI with pentapeptide repeats